MDSTFDLKRHIAPGTRFHSFIGYLALMIVGPTVIIFTAVSSMGLALIAWAIAGMFYWSRQRKARARMQGSAIRVGPDQFPEIHAAAHRLSSVLGIHEPDVYVIESNDQNAFALKHGSKHCVVLVDDIVHGALSTGNAAVLDFIIAHELAHHALGHTDLIRGILSAKYSTLSRLDEFSCDAVAHALVADGTAVRDAMTLLLVGPQLFARVNKAALDKQAREVFRDPFSRKAENGLTHPLLLRRYARLVEQGTEEHLPNRPVITEARPQPLTSEIPAASISDNGTERWAPPV